MTSLYQSHPATQFEETIPQKQHNSTTTLANTDGWILYYSPEGFPYYYNEITGESQWAENEQEHPEVEDYLDAKNEEEEDRNNETTSDLSGEDEHDEDEDESETTETEGSTTATEEEDGFDKEFQAYLESPEGQIELEEERQTVEKLSSRRESKSQSRTEPSRSYDHDSSAGTEMDDMVVNAFGTSAFKQEEERYNPYQQQPYQEQFNQQKRQQQYEYEQYEYENHLKECEQDEWQQEQENNQFADTYGLPKPKQKNHKKSQHSSSVTFKEDQKQRYYEENDKRRKSDRKIDKYSKKKNQYGKKKKNSADDLEGGDFRNPIDQQHNSDDNGDENASSDDDSESDVSVSSEDSDVQILREPLIPAWASWNNLTHFVDRTIRDPIVNASSKVYTSLVPEALPAGPKKNKKKSFDYDEEGGSGSGSDSDGDFDDNDIRETENVLNMQPLSLNKASHKSMKKRESKIKSDASGNLTASISSVYANISHYLSLSTLTTLLTTQQREWLQSTYTSTSTSVWNFVTNSAEYMVDGEPVRRGAYQKEQAQPLPP